MGLLGLACLTAALADDGLLRLSCPGDEASMQKWGYQASMTILEPLPTRNSPPGAFEGQLFSKPASDHA